MDYNFPMNEKYNPASSASSSLPSNANHQNQKKKSSSGKKNNGGSVVKLSTDPQSVAARERRHRISERFKILQSLVPGGSKMDTVSMLEGAIHYVKFLKMQIWLHQTMINFVDDFNSYHDPAVLDNIPDGRWNSDILHEDLPPLPFSSDSSCFQGDHEDILMASYDDPYMNF